MTEDDEEQRHYELHEETERRVRGLLDSALDEPVCRAHVLASILRDEIHLLEDADDLQDIFSLLGMMVYERAVKDQYLMHPVGNA